MGRNITKIVEAPSNEVISDSAASNDLMIERAKDVLNNIIDAGKDRIKESPGNNSKPAYLCKSEPDGVPRDYQFLRPWNSIIRDVRNRSISNGYSTVALKVIVDEHGYPVAWAEPTVKKLSPLSNAEALAEIINTLGED